MVIPPPPAVSVGPGSSASSPAGSASLGLSFQEPGRSCCASSGVASNSASSAAGRSLSTTSSCQESESSVYCSQTTSSSSHTKSASSPSPCGFAMCQSQSSKSCCNNPPGCRSPVSCTCDASVAATYRVLSTSISQTSPTEPKKPLQSPISQIPDVAFSATATSTSVCGPVPTQVTETQDSSDRCCGDGPSSLNSLSSMESASAGANISAVRARGDLTTSGPGPEADLSSTGLCRTPSNVTLPPPTKATSDKPAEKPKSSFPRLQLKKLKQRLQHKSQPKEPVLASANAGVSVDADGSGAVSSEAASPTRKSRLSAVLKGKFHILAFRPCLFFFSKGCHTSIQGYIFRWLSTLAHQSACTFLYIGLGSFGRAKKESSKRRPSLFFFLCQTGERLASKNTMIYLLAAAVL